MTTRRQFIKAAACVTSGATVTLILTPLGSLLAGCASEGSSGSGETTSSNPTVPCSGVGARSSTENGHTHDLCVPASELTNPPAAGASYTTTTSDGHTHDVIVDAAQLSSLERGEVVRITSASQEEHMHVFTLARAGTITPSPPIGGGGGSSSSSSSGSGVY